VFDIMEAGAVRGYADVIILPDPPRLLIRDKYLSDFRVYAVFDCRQRAHKSRGAFGKEERGHYTEERQSNSLKGSPHREEVPVAVNTSANYVFSLEQYVKRVMICHVLFGSSPPVARRSLDAWLRWPSRRDDIYAI
jgi:hypothetical protein